MNFRIMMIAVAALAAPAAGASAQGYYGYGGYGGEQGYLPPPPYVYTGGVAPGSACGGGDFTLLGAHAGVTVLGFGLNAGADLTAPTGCSGYGYGYGYGVPQFAPRAYAPPPPAYAPPPPYQGGYDEQPAWGQQSYGYPCGCGPQGW